MVHSGNLEKSTIASVYALVAPLRHSRLLLNKLAWAEMKALFCLRCRIVLVLLAPLHLLCMTVALPSSSRPEIRALPPANSSLSNPATIQCSPRYLSPPLSDCRDTVRLMPLGRKVLDFWDTQEPPRHGERTPQSWQWPRGECQIGLHFPQNPTTLRDWSSWDNIRRQAGALVDECVRDLRQGGDIKVGVLGSLQLTVFQEVLNPVTGNQTGVGVGPGTSGVETT